MPWYYLSKRRHSNSDSLEPFWKINFIEISSSSNKSTSSSNSVSGSTYSLTIADTGERDKKKEKKIGIAKNCLLVLQSRINDNKWTLP